MKYRLPYIALTVLALTALLTVCVVSASFAGDVIQPQPFNDVASTGIKFDAPNWEPFAWPYGPYIVIDGRRVDGDWVGWHTWSPRDYTNQPETEYDGRAFSHMRPDPSDPSVFIYEKPWYLILPSEGNPEPWYLVLP